MRVGATRNFSVQVKFLVTRTVTVKHKFTSNTYEWLIREIFLNFSLLDALKPAFQLRHLTQK